MSVNLKPLGDHLVVVPIEEESTTASGLVLPDTAKEKPQKGRVVAVGPGRRDHQGKRIPVEVNVDDVVIYAKYSGSEFKLGDEKMLILNEPDILAIAER